MNPKLTTTTAQSTAQPAPGGPGTPARDTPDTPVLRDTHPMPNLRARTPAPDAVPWWRVTMVWVVLSGPASVVVASLITAVVAWRHIDPVLSSARPGQAQPADDVPVPADPKNSLAPAMKARNHAATPRP